MRYETPVMLEDAVRLLSEETGIARILAGGTDVLVQLNSGLVEPDLVVDIKRLPGMADITAENGGYR
ncbi:MAG: FAD binding domain-containing protein, partial [Geminicoccaceae bacterium]